MLHIQRGYVHVTPSEALEDSEGVIQDQEGNELFSGEFCEVLVHLAMLQPEPLVLVLSPTMVQDLADWNNSIN